MATDTDKIISKTGSQMQKSIQFLESELSKIRAGKASPKMVEGIMVDYYGSPTPINQVANVSVADTRTLTIQPWEKGMIQALEKALFSANLGVTPQNDGEMIRLFMPPLTEDRRKDLVKQVKAEGENAKISIRNARREALEEIKKLEKDGLSEDEAKNFEGRVQGLTDKHSEQIDTICNAKEKEIMTI